MTSLALFRRTLPLIAAALLLSPVSGYAAPVTYGHALVDAADRGDMAGVKRQLRSQYVDGQGRFGATALMRAAFRGHQEIVRALLDAGADVNLSDIGGASALHVAAHENRVEVISLLARRGAEVNALDADGWTPLMRAAENRHLAAARALLSLGADPNAQSDRGETALSLARKNGDAVLAAALKAAGATLEGGRIAEKKERFLIIEKTAQPLSSPSSVQPLLGREYAAAQDWKNAEAAPSLIPPVSKNVFLLQLGAFPSEELAVQYWQSLRARHGDLLEGLDLKVAPVALPPENKKVFRTQAGFVASRDLAQSICAKLRATGADCFIVESVPNPTAAPPQMADSGQVRAMAANAAPLAGEDAAPERPWVAIDEEEAAAIAPVPAPQAPAPAPAPMTRAVAEPAPQPVAVPEPEAVPAPAALPEPPAARAPAPAPILAEPAPREAREELPWMQEASAPAPMLDETPRAVAAPQPVRSLPPVTQRAAMEPAAAPARAARPKADTTYIAPSDSPTVRDLRSQAKPAPLRLASPAPVYAPPAPVYVPPAPPVAAEPREPVYRSAPGNEAMTGDVEVAEAIRVPLSQDNVAPPSANRLAYRVMPSDPKRIRTQWLEIGSFASEQQALGYWNNLRSTYSNHLDALRVRVTRPLLGLGRTSLRVGPLTSETDTASLCTVAVEQGLACRAVTDLGVSSANAVRGQPTRVSREEVAQATYYRNQARQAPAPGAQAMYWVQLGSYTNEGEANYAWDNLRSVHSQLLGRMQKNITVPRFSSATRQIYRLRTGPFLQRFAAADLCDGLRRKFVSCVVVQGN